MITRGAVIHHVRRHAGVTDSGPCRIRIVSSRPSEPVTLTQDERGRRLIIVARAYLQTHARRQIDALPVDLA